MNESTLAAKRWALNIQGFGNFRRAGREAFFQNAVFFPGLKLGGKPSKSRKKHRKNTFIVGNQRDF